MPMISPFLKETVFVGKDLQGTFLFPKNTGDLRPYSITGGNTCPDFRIFHFIIKALLQGLPTGICHTARDTTGMCEAGFC